LLCDTCEQRIGRLERSFSQAWYHRGLIPKTAPPDFLDVHGLDYSQFKLFHLSLLWRAGVASTRPFGQVRLGPYEEPLRRSILDVNVPPAHEYPIYAFVLRDPNTHEVEHAIVTPPSSRRIEGVRCYSAIFAGCEWFYFVAQAMPPLPRSLMLSDAGMLRMPVINYTDHKSVTDFIKKWNQSTRRSLGRGST
jgi:hypothetical protein